MPLDASANGHPLPLRSSAVRGWQGVLVEHYRACDVEVLAPFPEHTVTLHLRWPLALRQRRSGRTRDGTIVAGDVVIAAAGEPKFLQHRGEAEVVKVKLAPWYFERVGRAVCRGRASRPRLVDNFGTRDTRLETLCREFHAELYGEAPGDAMVAESLAMQLAIHLLRHQCVDAAGSHGFGGRLPAHKLRRAIEYMDAHLQDALTLDSIGKAISVSPFHFAHLFKQTTGRSPHHYLIELRLERAKSLLVTTEMSVTEIAQCVGYANASHFAVAFHRAVGVPPREYRRNT